jgi:hypothetical protein
MVEVEGLNKTYHRKNLATAQPTNPADGFQPPLIRMLCQEMIGAYFHSVLKYDQTKKTKEAW